MSDHQKQPEQLKQQLLDQINARRDAIESLSDEELESVVGGYMIANTNTNAGAGSGDAPEHDHNEQGTNKPEQWGDDTPLSRHYPVESQTKLARNS